MKKRYQDSLGGLYFIKKRLRPKDRVEYLILLFVLIYTVIFSYYTILRHYAFISGAWDLGTYEQALWTTIHSGRLFWTNPDPVNLSGYFFGTHFSPILFIVLAIYAIHQATETLLVLQSFVIALGALPLYWLARDELKSKFGGVAFALMYLLYPPLQGVNWFDFHPQAFLPALYFFAFYFFKKEKWSLYFVSILLVLSVNEVMPSIVAFMGLYGLWTRRNILIEFLKTRRRVLLRNKVMLYSIVTIVLASVWLFIALKIIYSINPTNPFTMWYSTDPTRSLGTSLQEVIVNILTHPLKALELAFTPLSNSVLWYQDLKYKYLFGLLVPLMFMSLLDLPSLLIATPWLAASLLSNVPSYITPVGYQYPAHILSFIFISAVYGLKHLGSLVNTLKARFSNVHFAMTITSGMKRMGTSFYAIILVIMLLTSSASVLAESPIGLNSAVPQFSVHDQVLESILSLIPMDASVSAQNNLFPHLARRLNAYPYPSPNVEYIFVDTMAWQYRFAFPLPHVNSSGIPSFEGIITSPTENGSFGLFAAMDGVYLYKKGFNGEPNISPFVTSHGLLAKFYTDPYLGGNSIAQMIVSDVYWDWGIYSPIPGVISKGQYGIIFEGYLLAPKSGNYMFSLPENSSSTFNTRTILLLDDRVELKTDYVLQSSTPTNLTNARVTLSEGLHKITIKYANFNLNQFGSISLKWQPPWRNSMEVVSEDYLYQKGG